MRRAFLAALFLVACPSERHPDSLTGGAVPQPDARPRTWTEAPEKEGLQLELSEDDPRGAAVEVLPPVDARVLSEAETRALLARAPALEADGDEGTAFAFRPASQPPPLTGARVEMPFPPEVPATAPDVASGPLSVVRYSPEGAVPIAPHLSVTFDQPMVAVTSQDEAARVRPVKISPEPPGKWRWIGAKTVLFEPSALDRFPMATTYKVEVPAGTASATGGALSEAKSWTFTTPPPTVVGAYPTHGPHRRDPVVALTFDQAVDPDAVAEHVTLTSRGTAFPLRRATADEIAADPSAKAMSERGVASRMVFLHPAELLPAATSFQVVVGAGTPSAEGPNVTAKPQTSEFRTYDPLSVARQYCWQNGKTCMPGGQFTITMNNPLDEDAFDPESVIVEPAIPRQNVWVSGSQLVVGGNSAAHTTYAVTLPATLRDTFGQTLGAPTTLRFTTGGLPPSFQGPSREVMVLDPSARPAMSIFTVNHRRMRVRVFRAGPEHFAAFSSWMRRSRYDGVNQGEPPLQRLADQTVEVAGYVDDTLIETAIDLSPWLNDGLGQVVVWVEPKPQSTKTWEQIHVIRWVQATKIGLSAFRDGQSLLGWATNLADGAPLEGVELTVHGAQSPDGPRAASDGRGLATLALRDSSDGPHLLVARRGADTAILPENAGWWNEYGGWRNDAYGAPFAWYVFDDRQMYRPGETVSVKGWIRQIPEGPTGDVRMPAPMPQGVTWTAQDSQGNEIGKGRAAVSATGGFDFQLDLPGTPNLGYAYFTLRADGTGHETSHGFQIQEFRRPEYEVGARVDPGPYVLGDHATFEVSAAYYAGGALPGADVNWSVTATAATYQPPGWEGFQFGEWTPWWRGFMPMGRFGGAPSQSFSGRTDATGTHRLGVDFISVNPPRPHTVSAEATVTDVNRQRWTASASALVHPAAWYVGLKAKRPFVKPGEKLEVDAVLVDLDGAVVPGRDLEIVLSRLTWRRTGGEWKEVEIEPSTCAVTTTAQASACTFRPDEGGAYKISARIRDAEGRLNETSLRVWVSGPTRTPMRGVEMQELTVVPERETYQPGETARVLVQAPFAPAEGLWTLRRGGRVTEGRFALPDGSATLEIPITEAHLPGVTLAVDVVGSAERTDDAGEVVKKAPRRPAQATGSVELKVPPLLRALSVEVTPRAPALSPGGTTELVVRVKDAAGAPVSAEVALVAVDEAVLSLSGYRIPDPLEIFYQSRGDGVSAHHLRDLLELAAIASLTPEGEVGGDADMMMERSESAVMRKSAGGPPPPPPSAMPMAAMAPGGAAEPTPDPSGPAIALREDFNATALFAPSVQTDGAGVATVTLKLPDSLTRYRIMVVAVSGAKQFGTGESSVTARLPLMLRPSPPRFLNFGDRVEMPLVVQNQTDAPQTVRVALQAVNARMIDGLYGPITGPPVLVGGREASVPANDRIEIRIPVAADLAGKARFQAVIASGDFADAARFELPVWTPATAEAFATYGVIDQGAISQPVKAPDDVWVQFGGLEVSTASTNLQALTDAVLYLVQYPFECNEQMASRILAVAALRDVLQAFESEQLPPPDELKAAVARDLERLQIRQRGDGGFGFWGPAGDQWPYVTVHVTHALVRAKAQGYDVNERMLTRALGYVRHIERFIPGWYSPESRRAIIAYSLHVRELAGDADVAKAKALVREVGTIDRLSLEAIGWILPTLHAGNESALVEAAVRHIDNNVAETAGNAHFVTSYSDGAHVLMHSSRRVDGVLLEALIRVRPKGDLIPKVVSGLLAHRRQGRWGNTQENSFVLLALHRYFQVYEAQTPDFVARVWLGDQYVGDHAFRGRSTTTATTAVPMAVLSDPGGTQALVIQRDGKAGRLYYRVGMRYAPRDLAYEPADHGFTVERVYEAIDDPDDVKRDTDGNWRIKAGARLRVRLTMVAPARRYHVALVDPIPAGLEAQNPALATTGTLPPDPQASESRWWWWSRPWYEHQNLRDERVEAYTSLLWDGVWTYSYVAAATTPGVYVVPPAKAEEMYAPETFGRSASDRVIVE